MSIENSYIRGYITYGQYNLPHVQQVFIDSAKKNKIYYNNQQTDCSQTFDYIMKELNKITEFETFLKNLKK